MGVTYLVLMVTAAPAFLYCALESLKRKVERLERDCVRNSHRIESLIEFVNNSESEDKENEQNN